MALQSGAARKGGPGPGPGVLSGPVCTALGLARSRPGAESEADVSDRVRTAACAVGRRECGDTHGLCGQSGRGRQLTARGPRPRPLGAPTSRCPSTHAPRPPRACCTTPDPGDEPAGGTAVSVSSHESPSSRDQAHVGLWCCAASWRQVRSQPESHCAAPGSVLGGQTARIAAELAEAAWGRGRWTPGPLQSGLLAGLMSLWV